MQGRDVDRRVGGLPPGREHVGGAGQQLFAPGADLVRVELEALGQLPQGGIALQRGEGDLGLEGGGVIATGTTGHEDSWKVSERSLGEPACLHSPLFREPGPRLETFARTHVRDFIQRLLRRRQVHTA